MSTKKIVVIFAITAIIVAVVTGYLITTYAQEPTTPLTSKPMIPMKYNNNNIVKYNKIPPHWRGLQISLIEIDPEYNSTVLDILKSNPETSQLLEQGFSVKAIKPLIKAYISANGEVTLKATQAITVLTNNTAVYTYIVDISNKSVTLLSYHLLVYQNEYWYPCKTPT